MKFSCVYSGLPESKARALDNMGRAYAKMGCYKKAINMYVVAESNDIILSYLFFLVLILRITWS